MTTIKLREHQIECIAAVKEHFAAGKKRVLAVLATGAGKTIIYLSLANEWASAGKRVLILAHRRELIHQPIERAEQFYPLLARKMGIVMAEQDEPGAQVVVATVQTASRDAERLKRMGKFDYVVLDEAHHGTAESYKKLVEQFPDARWFGLTATPFRHDGDSLAKVFDSVAYRLPITAAIDRGVLVPFDAYGFSLPVSIKGVAETMDGWAEEALGYLLSAGNVMEVVYEKWAQYCGDRRTICFTSSVKQAHATAAYFHSRGVAAAAVDGSTPKKTRDAILEKFQDGKIQVVANCQVWTEGVDVPAASAALMVCPTKSDLAYVQKLGRVLRTFKDKKNAVILDFAPQEERNIVMAGDILGVPRLVKKETEKAVKAGVLVGAARVDDFGVATTVDPSVVLMEALQYLRRGRLAWSLIGNVAVTTLSTTSTLAIELPDPSRLARAEDMRLNNKNGSWTEKHERLYRALLQHRMWVIKQVSPFIWRPTDMDLYKDMETAIAAGESHADIEFQPQLAKRKNKWRNRPASPAQINYMRRLRVKPPDGCTSGQAAQMITHAQAIQAINAVRKSVDQKIMDGEILVP